MIFPDTKSRQEIFRSIKMTDEIILQLTTTALCNSGSSSSSGNNNYNCNHQKINHVTAYALLDVSRKKKEREKNCRENKYKR